MLTFGGCGLHNHGYFQVATRRSGDFHFIVMYAECLICLFFPSVVLLLVFMSCLALTLVGSQPMWPSLSYYENLVDTCLLTSPPLHAVYMVYAENI